MPDVWYATENTLENPQKGPGREMGHRSGCFWPPSVLSLDTNCCASQSLNLGSPRADRREFPLKALASRPA